MSQEEVAEGGETAAAPGEGGESAAPEECLGEDGGESATHDPDTDGCRATPADLVDGPEDGAEGADGADQGPRDEDVEQSDEADGDQNDLTEGTPSQSWTGCHWLRGDPSGCMCFKDPTFRLEITATDEFGEAFKWTEFCEEHLFIAHMLATGIELEEISSAIAAIQEWGNSPVYSLERILRLRTEVMKYHFAASGGLIDTTPK